MMMISMHNSKCSCATLLSVNGCSLLAVVITVADVDVAKEELLRFEEDINNDVFQYRLVHGFDNVPAEAAFFVALGRDLSASAALTDAYGSDNEPSATSSSFKVLIFPAAALNSSFCTFCCSLCPCTFCCSLVQWKMLQDIRFFVLIDFG